MASSADGKTVTAMNSWTTNVVTSRNGGSTWVAPTVACTDVSLGSVTMAPDASAIYIRSFNGANGFYVSTDYGVSFTQKTSLTLVIAFSAYDGGIVAIGTKAMVVGVCWSSISASYDGKHIATGGDGNGSCATTPVYVSGDSGATWSNTGAFIPSAFPAAISNDGRRIVFNDTVLAKVHVSNNRGASFTRYDTPVLSVRTVGSSDLSTLYVGAGRNLGGLVYKSVATLSATNRSTTGVTGSVSGGANDALELQFLGAGQGVAQRDRVRADGAVGQAASRVCRVKRGFLKSSLDP